MFRLAGRNADICFIPEENPREFSRVKDEVVRAAKEQNRTGIPSIACLVGIRAVEGKDDFRLRLENATSFGTSYVVAGVERKRDYLHFIELLAKDIMPSFG